MVIVPIVRPIMAIVTAAGIMATATSVIAKEEETVEPPERPIGTRVLLLHGVPNRGVPFVSRIRSLSENKIISRQAVRNHCLARLTFKRKSGTTEVAPDFPKTQSQIVKSLPKVRRAPEFIRFFSADLVLKHFWNSSVVI